MDRLSRARRLVPHQRELGEPHARRRDLHLRGPAAELRGPARARALAPAPGAALPPEARLPAGPDRAPVLGRRPGLQPRVPRAPLGAARRPGSEEQLRNMAARVFSQQLDRTKPLWELWMVQGLTRKRFAFVTKTHHALVDGVSGVDIATVLFDVKPVPEPAEPDHDWIPSPTPSARPAAGQGRRGPSPEGAAAAPLRRLEHAVEHPQATAAPGRRGGRGARRGRLELRQPGARQCRSTQPIGSHRRFEWVRGDLAQFKRIKAALGGTVNDVVLAVVTGALRQWLHARGVRTEGLELRAQVPVSIRADRRARPARQQDRRGARPDPRLRRGPGAAARDLPQGRWRASSSPSRRSAPR